MADDIVYQARTRKGHKGKWDGWNDQDGTPPEWIVEALGERDFGYDNQSILIKHARRVGLQTEWRKKP